MTRRARHEQVNDAFRLRGNVTRPCRKRIRSRAGRGCYLALASQLRQRCRADSDSAFRQKPAPRERSRIAATIPMRLTVHAHSFVIVSSKFSSTRLTTVQAASCGGVIPLGKLGGLAGSSAANSQGLTPPALNRSSCLPRSTSSTAASVPAGERPVQRRKANARRSQSVAPPSRKVFSASARAHSKNNGSLSVASAWSGVFDRTRRTQANSPLGASNVVSTGYGTERKRNVYKARR